jgi:hypothetical protein
MLKGGAYNFKYATLDAILNAVRKPLSDNGLSITCYMANDEKGEVCTTRLYHSSGQWIECSFPLIVGADSDAQRWGSALTYAKRNGIAALLAIHADEDDDANRACGNDAEPLTEVQQPLPPSRPPKQQPPKQPTRPPASPPPNSSAPQGDDERLTALYKFAEKYKGESAKLLGIITDMKVEGRKTTVFNQMQKWDSAAKRQVGEMFLASCLSDSDRAVYLEFLLERRKEILAEVSYLSLQIPKQGLAQDKLNSLVEKCCTYLTAIEESKGTAQ